MAKQWALATILAGLMITSTAAHEVKYEGTVAAVKLDPYSASDGIVATLEVSVRDRKRAMVFDITQYTRLWRGNSPVTFATARIQKDEAVTVTFSDEEAEKGALEVRLPSPK
jgi:hypothetical protein